MCDLGVCSGIGVHGAWSDIGVLGALGDIGDVGGDIGDVGVLVPYVT